MLAPHEPTWLEWAEVLAVTVLWYVGPALVRDALDHHFDRPRHRPRRRKGRGAHDPHGSRPPGRPRPRRASRQSGVGDRRDGIPSPR